MPKVKKRNIRTSDKSITDFLFITPLKKDNTNINTQNFIENVEYPNTDVRTWYELSSEEQQKLIDNTAEPLGGNYGRFDMKKLMAAKRYSDSKGYDVFDTRTGEQILKDREDYRTYQVRKYLDEQNINNETNKKKCGGKTKVKRNKAFGGLGVLIGAGVGALSNIIGSIITSNSQRAASEAQLRAQEKLFKRQENLNEDSQRLQSEIAEQANQGIYDELRQKKYKCGGKIKARKKAEWGTEDTSSLLSGLIGGLGSIGSSAINSNTALQINANNLKLQELETAAKNKQYQYGYVQSDFAKRMRKYLNGEDSVNEFDNSKRTMFPNKQLYML